MIIGIDARPLQTASKYRGIGRVLENILEYGRPAFAKHTIYFYLENSLETPKIINSFKNKKTFVVNSGLHKKRFIRAMIGEYSPVKPHKSVDVFLQVEASLGIPKNRKSVVFFHDAIPLFFKEKEVPISISSLRGMKRKIASEIYWKRYINSLASYAHATRIISISKHSDSDLRKHVLPGKIIESEVIYLSATPVRTMLKRPQYISPNNPYLLYVGGIDLRKNVVGIVEDFGVLSNKYPNLRLIFVGKEFHKKSELDDFGWSKIIERYKIQDKIITPGFISDEELAWLYANATAFVFPSRYEGFGLPVLEAMQAGCPVIAYRNSSIPEVAGDAAILVEDGKSMVPAIEKLVANPKLRANLVKKGKAQAAKFSWEKTAKETVKSLEVVGEY